MTLIIASAMLVDIDNWCGQMMFAHGLKKNNMKCSPRWMAFAEGGTRRMEIGLRISPVFKLKLEYELIFIFYISLHVK